MTNREFTLFVGLIAAVLTGCVRNTWSYRAVPDINISRPNQLDTKGTLVLKTEPLPDDQARNAVRQWLKQTDPFAASKRTVLMASFRHDSFLYHHNVGRTLVIFLDGQPRPGQYWLTPDNAVLLTYSAYSAPTRERVNLAGSIQIDQVKGEEIVAEVAVRDTTEIDSSEALDRPWDPVTRQWPFVLKGTHTFAVTTPTDPIFEKSAVKWVAQ